MLFVKARNYTRVTGLPRRIDLIVLHTMEYPEKPSSAEWCARYFANQKPHNPPEVEGSSAHYLIDNDSVIQGVRDEDVAWAAPGANHNGLQIEHAGYAIQGSAGWHDTYSQAMLDLSARNSARLCDKHLIPARYVGIASLKLGVRGITTHANVSEAFKRSNHWDPGPNFPIADYVAAVKKHLNPTEEESVPPWFKDWFEWRLFDGNPATRPATAPEAIEPQYLAIVKQAERFRAAKPDSEEIAALKARIDNARKALA